MSYKGMLKYYEHYAPRSRPTTREEKYSAEKAVARTFTQFDLAIAIGIVADLVLSYINVTTHWSSVGIITCILALYLCSLLLSSHLRPLIGRLLLAGIIAGICELFTDASGETVAHSLIYPIGAPMIWASPLYMPLSWMVILTHLGYVAWRLRALLGIPQASLVSALLGAIQIPLYEELAYYGGWWRYIPTHLMIGHTPLYVLLFEGLIVALLPLLYDRIERRTWLSIVFIGVIIGIWMPFAALISWLLLGL